MKKSVLYTRTGDQGLTSLVGGERVAKNSLRVKAYGDIDELNSQLGLIQAHSALNPGVDRETRNLRWISNLLFNIGAYLATPSPKSPAVGPACSGVNESAVETLEKAIDELDAEMMPQTSFILPGGSISAAHAHVSRAVCRRAERSILDLRDSGAYVDPNVLTFVNRLSDYLFILARKFNQLAGIEDTPWVNPA